MPFVRSNSSDFLNFAEVFVRFVYFRLASPFCLPHSERGRTPPQPFLMHKSSVPTPHYFHRPPPFKSLFFSKNLWPPCLNILRPYYTFWSTPSFQKPFLAPPSLVSCLKPLLFISVPLSLFYQFFLVLIRAKSPLLFCLTFATPDDGMLFFTQPFSSFYPSLSGDSKFNEAFLLFFPPAVLLPLLSLLCPFPK